ncbi:MAG: hypothetical protein JXR95_05810 [Deltaproteobacteria bacterium]|nr:hypothetical protein [Deltaproteobacteria bacterium]
MFYFFGLLKILSSVISGHDYFVHIPGLDAELLKRSTFESIQVVDSPYENSVNDFTSVISGTSENCIYSSVVIQKGIKRKDVDSKPCVKGKKYSKFNVCGLGKNFIKHFEGGISQSSRLKYDGYIKLKEKDPLVIKFRVKHGERSLKVAVNPLEKAVKLNFTSKIEVLDGLDWSEIQNQVFVENSGKMFRFHYGGKFFYIYIYYIESVDNFHLFNIAVSFSGKWISSGFERLKRFDISQKIFFRRSMEIIRLKLGYILNTELKNTGLYVGEYELILKYFQQNPEEIKLLQEIQNELVSEIERFRRVMIFKGKKFFLGGSRITLSNGVCIPYPDLENAKISVVLKNHNEIMIYCSGSCPADEYLQRNKIVEMYTKKISEINGFKVITPPGMYFGQCYANGKTVMSCRKTKVLFAGIEVQLQNIFESYFLFNQSIY